MSQERRGPPEQQEEIAIASNRAIEAVKRKFPGGLVPTGRTDEFAEVRINANLIWPPDRAVVTEQDVRDAHLEYLIAFDDWRTGKHDAKNTLRSNLDAYVKVCAKGEALLLTPRYYAQDQYALGYQFAKQKYEQVKPKEQAA